MASMCYNERKKLEFIKNPVIAEFLGMASNTDFTESDLENSILSNLVFDGIRERVCFCGKTATYSYRKAGLLH